VDLDQLSELGHLIDVLVTSEDHSVKIPFQQLLVQAALIKSTPRTDDPEFFGFRKLAHRHADLLIELADQKREQPKS
jgi:hypothetical protein